MKNSEKEISKKDSEIFSERVRKISFRNILQKILEKDTTRYSGIKRK